MIEVKLKDKVYNLPTSWDEIKLRQFKNIMLIDDKQDELDYKLDILSSLLECTVEELETASLNSLNSLYNRIEILLEHKPTEFLPETFQIRDKEFYFDNALEKNTTYGMFVDMSTFMESQNFWDVAEKVLAIFIRPVSKKKKDFRKWKGININNYPFLVDVEKYDSDKLEENSEYILECPMSYIFPVSVFFWNLSKELNQNILPSSPVMMNQIQMMEILNQKKNHNLKTVEIPSAKDGDGTQHSTPSVETNSGTLID